VGPESSGPGCHANAVCPPGAANARSYERWRHDSLGGRVIITRGHLKDWIPSLSRTGFTAGRAAKAQLLVVSWCLLFCITDYIFFRSLFSCAGILGRRRSLVKEELQNFIVKRTSDKGATKGRGVCWHRGYSSGRASARVNVKPGTAEGKPKGVTSWLTQFMHLRMDVIKHYYYYCH